MPVVTDPPHELADWIELDSLFSEARQSSRATLAGVLRRTGSGEEGSVDEDEEPFEVSEDERSQSAAIDAFTEIERRGAACGTGYPFETSDGSIRLKGTPEDSDYVFLLLLSYVGVTPGREGTAALFERLCTNAAAGYLGGTANRARAVRFGSPRPAAFAKFKVALDDLCLQLGEGGGCREGKGRHTGDGKLDIVAWRSFPDGRAGKVIAFGQCAAGVGGYETKVSELDATNFVKKWMRSPLLVDPVRLFFVPFCLGPERWEETTIDAGIVFDRCRIVACLGEAEADVALARFNATRRAMQEFRSHAQPISRSVPVFRDVP